MLQFLFCTLHLLFEQSAKFDRLKDKEKSFNTDQLFVNPEAGSIDLTVKSSSIPFAGWPSNLQQLPYLNINFAWAMWHLKFAGQTFQLRDVIQFEVTY
jgi:hypothetical protein